MSLDGEKRRKGEGRRDRGEGINIYAYYDNQSHNREFAPQCDRISSIPAVQGLRFDPRPGTVAQVITKAQL